MSKYEFWNPERPRTAAQYSHNCWRRREARSGRIDVAVSALLMFASGLFIGALMVRVAIQMVI